LKNEKTLHMLFEEILKNRNTRTVIYKLPVSSSDTKDICCKLEHHSLPDAVITNSEHVDFFRKNCSQSMVIDLSEYLQSDFEKEREVFTNLPHLDEIDPNKCEELFTRIVKFAKYLRIYDKQIGHANNLSGFTKGILYILDLWKKHGYYKDGNGAQVDIYTTCPPPRYSTPEKNRKNVADINRNLVHKLQKQFQWPVQLHVKEDHTNKFHARYLETQSANLLMERGFDFIRYDRNSYKFKSSVIQLKSNASKYLHEFRSLPDFECFPCSYILVRFLRVWTVKLSVN